jgi:pyruvate/2-oxoglutarate dehydrogenase complex dihydrolipoamide acyltransferase (E2) component
VSLLCAPGRRAFSAGAHALPALPSDAWASSHLSPAVAFLLRSGSYSPSSVHGTGRAGRILKADVLKAIKEGSIKQAPAGEHAHAAASSSAAASPAAAAAASVSTSPLRRDRTHTDIPLTNVRKVIASRLSASKQTIPHAYSTTTLRMDAILKLRAALKDAGRESIPSVNDFIIRASALALRTVPAVNSIYASKGAEIATPSSSVDISVAVATPTGLITPIVKHADTKRLDTIGAEVKELANRAKANKLKPEEFQGGSFTYVGHRRTRAPIPWLRAACEGIFFAE